MKNYHRNFPSDLCDPVSFVDFGRKAKRRHQDKTCGLTGNDPSSSCPRIYDVIDRFPLFHYLIILLVGGDHQIC